MLIKKIGKCTEYQLYKLKTANQNETRKLEKGRSFGVADFLEGGSLALETRGKHGI